MVGLQIYFCAQQERIYR